MTIAEKPHGRTRYNAGCRCAICKQANREHQRRLRAKRLAVVPPGEQLPPAEFTDGPVTEAVRAQLAAIAAAQERPGLTAVAIRLAQVLDRDDAVPQHASAAHRLIEALGLLTKTSTRRGRLSVVRSMTERS